ncbi:MAG TPA: beta-xylosidase, partial [Verrucomicrobiae bacterium]|nr:beta-xylosidase [Verrucomicrobiae bacterium]
DHDHSNAYALWQKMGSPQKPDAEQYAQLERAGHLAEIHAPELVRSQSGEVSVNFKLPRQAVSLLVIEWNSR